MSWLAKPVESDSMGFFLAPNVWTLYVYNPRIVLRSRRILAGMDTKKLMYSCSTIVTRNYIWTLQALTLVAVLMLGFFASTAFVLAGGGPGGDNDSSTDSRSYDAPNVVSIHGTDRSINHNTNNGDITISFHSGPLPNDGSHTVTLPGGDDNNTSYNPPRFSGTCPALQRYNQCISQAWDRMGEMYRSCGRTAPTCTTAAPAPAPAPAPTPTPAPAPAPAAPPSSSSNPTPPPSSVTLGSYLIPSGGGNLRGRTAQDLSTRSSRDIAGFSGDVGLYWEGQNIRYNTCRGSGPGFSGRTGDDNFWVTNRGYPNNEATINEPNPGSTNTYRITCDSTSGGTVTDTFRLTDGGTVPPDPDPDPGPSTPTPTPTPDPTVTLTPTVNNITINYGDTVGQVPFTVRNSETPDADNITVTISINGNQVDTSGDLDIPGGNSPVNHNEPLSTTFSPPVDNSQYPLEVCVSHPDEPRGSVCDTANINVNPSTQCFNGRNDDAPEDTDTDDADRGCWTDPTDPSTYDQADDDERDPLEDPEITTGNGGSDPRVVRQGDEITIEWEPNEDPLDDSRRDCSLSANIPYSPNTNVPADSATFTAERTAEYRIDCSDGPFDTVTIQVIPIIFET
jgi:hypothetical protein